MAELTFNYGTMDAGKSTLALQLSWQLRESRSDVELWTFGDRSIEGMVMSRIGIEASAAAVAPGADLSGPIETLLVHATRILVIDEAQFASVERVDALARLVDDHHVDVHAFGLSADFLLNLFPGSALLHRGLVLRAASHVIVLVRAKGSLQRARRERGRCSRGKPVLHGRRARRGRPLPGAVPHALPARSTGTERLTQKKAAQSS
jgi:hypothetical protein